MKINIRGKIRVMVVLGTVGLALAMVAGALFLQRDAVLESFASPTDMNITSNTTWTSDTEVTGTLTIETGATLTIDSSVPAVAITVTATNLVVETGAYISADGKGSAGGAAETGGVGTGAGGAGSVSAGGGGAGYGGAGGDGGNNTSSGGSTHGTAASPTSLGSGGGGGETAAGGAGGGAVKFVIAGTTTVTGEISARGADGSGGGAGGAGGGSGGSIWIDTDTLTGAGHIIATGGDGADGTAQDGGAGGGGRVHVDYSDNSGYTGPIDISAGATGAGSAEGGTGGLESSTGTLLITDPTDGESIMVGASQTIAWTDFGTTDNVKISYAMDGTNFNNVITASTTEDGSYSWTVPEVISTTVKLKVEDAANAAIYDISDAVFIFAVPTITITAPADGTTWYVGDTESITWTPPEGITGGLSFYYSTDGGSGYSSAFASSELNDGTYSWAGIPGAAFSNGADAKIKIAASDAFAQGITQDSAGDFSSGTESSTTASGGNVTLEDDDSLVGWWHMNEGFSSGADVVDSAGDNDGTATNATLDTTNKHLGAGCGSFNGTTAYVDIGNAGSGIKTIAFWMKANDITSRKIMDFDATDQIELDGSSDVTATSFPGTTTIYVDGITATTVTTAWHHIAITDTTGVNASALDIGRVSTGYFDGLIDEVRIYNRVLTGDEVIAQYASGTGTESLMDYKRAGGFTSGVIDTGGNTAFGNLTWSETLPDATKEVSAASDGLVGLWHMNTGFSSGADVVDSAGSHHGTSTDATLDTTDKKLGAGCGSFNGTSAYVTVADSADWDFGTEDFSVSAWIYCAEYSGGDPPICSQYADSNNFMFLRISGSGITQFYVKSGGSYTIQLADTSAIPLNTWTHIIVARSGDNFEIYENSVLVFSGTDPSSVPDYASALHIGGGTGLGYFNGLIDEVGIWDRALSGDEIRAMYGKANGTGIIKFQVAGSTDNSTWEDWTAPAEVIDETDLVSRWTMDSVWTDAVVASGNDGTAQDGATFNTDNEKVGTACGSFDGTDDYVSLADSSDWDMGSGSFTATAWIKASTASAKWTIIGNWDADSNKRSWSLNSSDTYSNKASFYVSTDGTSVVSVFSDASLNDNQWHHVAGIRNGDNVYIFVDGVIQSDTDTISGALYSNNACDIGRVTDGTTGYYPGLIDDVRIYSRALSGAEVQALFEHDGGREGLVSLWHMNSDWDDAMGNNNGTATGATFDTANEKLGTACGSFDGTSDYVDISSISSLSSEPASFTVGTWFKTSSSATDSSALGRHILFHHGLSGDQMSVGIDGGKLCAAYYTGSFTRNSGVATVSDGNWHHAGFVYTGSNSMTLYLDGNVDNTVTFDPVAGVATTSYIGAYYGAVSTSAFNGLIDEVAIYNRALSADEILAQYNQGMAGFEVNADYFTSSGLGIPTALDTKRYIKYRAYLDTACQAYTPTISSTKVAFATSGSGPDGTYDVEGISDAYTVGPGDLDHITVRDAASGGGSAVTTDSLVPNNDSIGPLYAAGYDVYDNFIADQSVTWALTGGLSGYTADLSSTSGTTTTFTPALNHTGVGTITADHATGGVTDDATGDITVAVGATTKLAFTTQPSSTADAGVPFSLQPVVAVQDAQGNTITSDSSSIITLARGDTGSGALQGTISSVQASSGLITCTDLYYDVAETMNILATGATDFDITHTNDSDFDSETTSNTVVSGTGDSASMKLLAASTAFTKHTIDGTFDTAISVYAIDVDDDGDIDVLGGALTPGDIAWYENNGSESFTKHNIDTNFADTRYVYATDLDDDGDIDVLGASKEGYDVTWWENNGSESFTKHDIDTNARGVHSVHTSDVDDDGDIDVLSGAYYDDDVLWYENNGSESFTKRVIDTNFAGVRDVYAIDVDSDGDIDVLATSETIDDVVWYENNGSESFTKHTIDANFTAARMVYPIDVDDDGDIDIFSVAGGGATYIAWYENNGSESFTKHTLDCDSGGACDIDAIDIDGDNDIDLVFVEWGGGNISWYENDGSESFTRRNIDLNYNGASTVYATDVDGDGNVDVLSSAYTDDDITWWENVPTYNASGTYTSDAIDMGIAFGILTWSADTTNCGANAVSIKVRTDTVEGMTGATAWASCTAFTTSGQDISSANSVTDGDQYLQYQITLATTDTAYTPILNSITISYSGTSLTSATSDDVVVSLAASSYIRVDDAAGGAGSAVTTESLYANNPGGTLTLYAASYDSGNNYLADQAVTWSVTQSTGTFVVGDLSTTSGTSTTFAPSLDNIGTGTITATLGADTDDTGTITVTPDAASKLVFTIPAAPITDAIASAAFNPQPTVHVQDQYDNVVIGDSTTQITLSATAGAATALQSSGVLTEQVSSGTIDFSGIYYNTAETITLTATNSGTAGETDTAADFATESEYAQENAGIGTEFDSASGVVKLTDGIDSHTKLLLHMDESPFEDSSDSNHTINKYADAGRSAEVSKFGGYSCVIENTGDYLNIVNHADWAFGSGDFTVDAWVKRNTTGSDHTICGVATSGGVSDAFYFDINTANHLRFVLTDTDTTEHTATQTGTITDTDWHHVAAIRDGNTITLYIDGAADGTADVTGKTMKSSALGLSVGRLGDNAGGYFNGYIDELRVTKGVTRWTAAFTAPTAAYTPGVYSTTKAYYVTTDTGSQLDASDWVAITDVDVTETLPSANTTTKYLVSFDGGSTWKYWSGSAWTAAADLGELQTYGMTKAEVEAITQDQWEGTGGFDSASTTTMDFAIDLKTTASGETPVVTQITVNYALVPGSPCTADTSENITVSPSTIHDYTVTGTSPKIAGAEWTQTVEAYDAQDNLVDTDSSTIVTMTSSTGNVTFYETDSYAQTTTTYTLSSGQFTLYAKDTVVESVTLTATDGASKTGTSGQISITAASASKLIWTTSPSSAATAGVAFDTQPVVTVQDTYGNTRITDDTTEVTAAALDSAGVDPATATLQGTGTVTASAGIVTFTDLYYNVDETITLTATSSPSYTETPASSAIDVDPPVLAFTTQPANPSGTAVAGESFDAQPVVTVQDQNGATITDDNTSQITLARETGTADLQGAVLTKTVTSGVATFSGVSYNEKETMTIMATNVGITTADTSVDFGTAGNYTQENGSIGTEFDTGVLSLNDGNDVYTKLLLHMDEADLTTDSGAENHTAIITANGNVARSDIPNPAFGTYSALFDGADDYLSATASADWGSLGDGDFAVDCWIYLENVDKNQFIAGSGTVNTSYRWRLSVASTGGANKLRFYDGATGYNYANYYTATSGYFSADTWYHVAVGRNSGTFNMYVDGAEVYTGAMSNFSAAADLLRIGAYFDDTMDFDGCIDEFRISKGTPRWTAAFTAPAAAYGGFYPTTAYYVTTTDTNQLDSTNWTAIEDVVIDETLSSASTTTKYLVSFDDRTTWKYWSDSAWVDSSLANLQTEGMTDDEVEAITQAEWESTAGTGGFSSDDTTFDIAVDLKTTAADETPTVDLITVTYATDPGAAAYTEIESSNVVVGAAAPNKLSFSVEPATSVAAGTTWDSFTVQILDQFDNLTTSTATVAVAPSAGSFSSGTASKAATAGAAAFADLAYSPTTAGITLEATSSGLTAGTSVSVAVTAGVLISPDVEPASLELNDVGNCTISFTTAAPIPADGDVLVTFPAGYVLTGTPAMVSWTVDTVSQPLTGMSVSVASQILTIVDLAAAVAAAGDVSITISNIQNPPTIGVTGTYAIETKTDGDVQIDTGTADGDNIGGGDLVLPAQDKAITHAAYEAGETPTTTIEFTTENPIEVDGDIQVTFPANYDLSGTLTVDSWTIDETPITDATSVTAANQILTVNIKTSVGAGSKPALTITGIKLPMLLGSTGTYAIETQTVADVQIDTGTAALNTITIPTITLVTPTAASITMTVGDSYDITWTNSGALLTGATTGTSVIPLLDRGIQLSYATDGANYNDTIAVRQPDETYAWTVPAEPGATLKVKAQDTFYQDLWDRTATDLGAGDVTDDTQVAGTANAASVYLDGASSANLVGHWKLNTDNNLDTTTTDSSDNSNTGTITGATWSTEGHLGSTTYDALSFDGDNDYVEIAYDSSLVSVDQTISCWVEFGDLGDGGIIADTTTGWGRTLSLTLQSDKIRYWSGNNTEATNKEIVSNSAPSLDVWIHIVGLRWWDGSNMQYRMYINDTLQSITRNSTWKPDSTTNAQRIGRSGSNYLNAIVDDVRVYNRALGATEITALYNSGAGTEGPGAYTATSGTFISQPLDTTANAALGTISWNSSGESNCLGMPGSDTDLVALWRFDDADFASSYIAQDATSNDLDLTTTVANDPAYTSGGKISGALTFNGTDSYLQQKVYDTEQGTLYASTAAANSFFIDLSQDFSEFEGASGNTPYMIVAKDSGDDVGWGYIGEMGSGETLDTDKVTNGGFDSDTTGWSCQYGAISWESAGQMRITYGGYDYNQTYQSITLTAGKLYKISVNVISGAGYANGYLRNGTDGFFNGNTFSKHLSSGVNTFYVVPTATTSAYGIKLQGGTQNTGYIIVDDISVQEVLDPATTTGIKIYSTKDGSTQTFAGTTDFDANDISSYEIRKTDFQITGAMTVGAWVKRSVTGTGYVITKRPSASENSYHMRFNASDQLQFTANIGGISVTTSQTYGTDWIHVTAVFNPSVGAYLYVDGVEVASDTAVNAALGDTHDVLNVGAYASVAGFFTGTIDEPFIYSRALTAAEINELYNAGPSSLMFQVASNADTYTTYYGPEDSLVGYWKFNTVISDQLSVISDSSGQGNDGTLGTAELGDAAEPTLVANTAKPNLGNALSFDGVDDYVNIGDVLPILTEGTVGIWFKRIQAGSGYQMMITDNMSQLEICYMDNALQFYVNNVNISNVSNASTEWQHIIGTFSETGDFQRLYLNGSSIAQGTYPGSAATRVRNFGSRNGAYAFNGLLDDVRIYSRALSAAEITALYNTGAGTEEIAGRTSTYYNVSGQALPGNLDGDQYLKYKAYFSTGNTSYSPILSDVTLSFAGPNPGDRDIVGVSTNAFTIAADALSAGDVEMATEIAGITEDCTVTFTTVNAIPSTGTIVVTFPAGFDVGQTHGSVPTGTGMDGVFAAAVSGQVVTVTRSGGSSSAAGVKTLTLADIKNPDTIGVKGTYEIKTTRSDGNTVDEKTDVAADTIVVGGTITVADVIPASLVAGAVGNVSVEFTAINPIPADGVIEITLPETLANGFAFDSGAATAATSSTMDGTFSAVDAGSVMTVTRQDDGAQEAAGAQVITLTNIKVPEYTGSTGTYTIKTASAAGIATGRIDQITNVTADDITAGVLTDAGTVTVTSPTYIAGDNTQNYTVAITTANIIPSGGDIKVAFDADYDLTGALAVVTGVGKSTHTATVNDLSGDLIITLTEEASAGATVSMVISGIKNPVVTQTTDAFTVTTRNVSDVTIDTGTSAGVTIDVVLTLTAPNGSEEWISRTAHNIVWTEGAGADDFNLVDLYYSLDGGSTWKLIAGSAPNTGTYSWTLPFVNADTATCKVKVETNNTGAITSDVSDNTFTIQVPDITITSPTSGNETWAVGSTQKITWTTTPNLITHVKLEYSTDGGVTYPNLIAASAPNGSSGGSHDWTVPSAISASVKIRATDASETAATLGGAAAAKVSADVVFEDASKTLALDVITDFAVGDDVTINGLYFTDFSASAADNLELEMYNNSFIYTVDNKTITVGSAAVSPQYRGSAAGDGWDYGESGVL